jgi:hypothetical protein
MSFTLTFDKFCKLLECIEPYAGTDVDDKGRLHYGRTEGEHDIVLLRARLKPLFAWRAGKPFDWIQTDLARVVPPTKLETDAADLAWSAAKHCGALGVFRTDSEWKKLCCAGRYHAVFDIETSNLDAVSTREPRIRKYVSSALGQLSNQLTATMVKYGSAGANLMAVEVEHHRAFVLAMSAHMAADLPVRGELDELADAMKMWTMRAAIPTDEALLVASEVLNTARAWNR